ncbi:hypothetical protein D6B98_19565 [Bradyrhizobium sp. LVM 105]|nr:hypothetical protein D6B98_19565 [Bradyrhizobium sp. LVM 105]
MADQMAPSEPCDDTGNGEAARKQRAINPRPLACTRAAQPWHRDRLACQIGNVGKGMPAIPRPQENEGVGEHVRTRFHVDPKAACEIAEPLFRRTAPNEENLFLLPDRQSERSDR